jgi:two-component system CheB/CheR fusion protein
MVSRDVVVVGASAGGVQAMRNLVAALPPGLPAAILVVLHLPPGGVSALVQILSRAGPLRAEHPVDGQPIAPGRIYVAPPDHHLLIRDGRVTVSRGPRENGHRPAIDPLFRSAAQAHGLGTVGVVLSGTLDDGAAGLAAIARRGGVAVVQDPHDAMHAGMPMAALTEVPDALIAPAAELGAVVNRLVREEIPAADLARHVRHAECRRPAGSGTPTIAPPVRPDGTVEGTVVSEPDEQFESLLELLKETRGFDFTGYKRSSLTRRVNRRMQQLSVPSYPEYVDYLQVHQAEYTALFNTVLINVTDFFRDQDSWLQLRGEVLPRLLAAKKPTEPIRIWSAGCATGQEAYSIAMVLAEELGVDEFRDRVKIYATDVDEEALSAARQASYGENEVRGVPTDLLAKYFERNSARYSFVKDLRRTVIFGRNDLVQDAPISRVDLLSCRNTLMYFNAETQAKVLARFNFALNPAGVLFLGKAEMLLSHGQLFTPVDLQRRFFRKVPRALGAGGNGPALGVRDQLDADRLQTEALLASPVATLVLTADGTVAGVNQRAEAIFGASPRDLGRPFQDLDVSYRPVELRPLLEEVHRDRRPVTVRDTEWLRGSGEVLTFDVQLVPLTGPDGADTGVAIFFTDVSRYRKLQSELEYANRQVETAYEELQSAVEELETTNEELQSTVEELETTNEELQSTVEELETMNEELQATNDELQSSNDELRERTHDLDGANTFLGSVLRSLRSAVVVVDADLVVRIWNRRAEDLWGLRPEEAVGQHLLNLDIGVSTDRLRPLVREVLTGTTDTAEELVLDAVNRRGRAITIRVGCTALPDLDGGIAGAIIVMDETPPPS